MKQNNDDHKNNGQTTVCPFSSAHKISQFDDGFGSYRTQQGVLDIDDQNDPVKMILGLKDVRKSAHNWKIFQSGAIPGRIVVPSEVAIRSIRQIPFELDPPSHTQFRALIEPWFKRPLQEPYQKKLSRIINDALDSAFAANDLDVVRDISLVVQSKALTTLLNVPIEEAQVWIGWGTHVFRSDDNPLDSSKANALYDYLDNAIAQAKVTPKDDLYSLLLGATVDGNKLTDDEVKGIMILTFAGGRDTVINALTNTFAFFADHPEQLAFIRQYPESFNSAVEELLRYFSPLTHMGRIATENTEIKPHTLNGNDTSYEIKKDTRISLCWASANRDESVFDNPNEVDLERKVNPHVAFGFGVHNCLGATHARTLLRLWIQALAERVENIDVKSCDENIEHWGEASRKVGFHKLIVNVEARKA